MPLESQIAFLTPESMLAATASVAQETLLRDGRLICTFYGFTATDLAFSMAVVFETEGHKAAALAVVRARLKEARCIGYSVATEAWLSAPDRNFADRAAAIRWARAAPEPESDPNRHDVISILAVTRSGRAGQIFEIKRNWKKKPVGLREIRPEDLAGVPRLEVAVEVLGRFADLFS